MGKFTAKPGDVLAFGGNSLLSAAINICTFGLPRVSVSHVAIVVEHEGRLFAVQSLCYAPRECAILERQVVGVQAHYLEDALHDGGRVYLYPLSRQLYLHERERLRKVAVGCLGRPYDTTGALRAGGWLLATIEGFFRGEDVKSLFCSEFVAHALQQTGVFSTPNASAWSPNSLLRRLRRAGTVAAPLRLA